MSALLPDRLRAPFRLALAMLLTALVLFVFLRWQAPMVAMCALGFPMLFVLYLHESDVDDDVPVRILAVTAALGVALGCSWALLTGGIVADSYDVALRDAPFEGDVLLEGFLISIGGAVAMLIPALAVRLLRPGERKSLNGFTIGALGAVGFTAAATLTRLAPQFATGPIAHDQSVGVLLTQAGIQGVALPLLGAAVGGLVGVALWFTQSAESAGRWRARLICLSLLVMLALYGGLGLMETAPLTNGQQFGLQVVVTVAALLSVRIGLQMALRHEAHDEMRPDAAPATGSYSRLLLPLAAGTAVTVAGAFAAAMLATPPVPRFVCPPDCGRPSFGKPVEANPRFESDDGRFSVQYAGPGEDYDVVIESDGVELQLMSGDTGTMELFGMPAAGRSAEQIVEDLIDEGYPDATTAYEIPNAQVGYQPGYGVVADVYPQGTSGTYTRLRVLVMVSVRNDYALIASAVGPYHEFSPSFGTGHPSGANLEIAVDMAQYANSFLWR